MHAHRLPSQQHHSLAEPMKTAKGIRKLAPISVDQETYPSGPAAIVLKDPSGKEQISQVRLPSNAQPKKTSSAKDDVFLSGMLNTQEPVSSEPVVAKSLGNRQVKTASVTDANSGRRVPPAGGVNCPTDGYTVSKTTQFIVSGSDEELVCLALFLAGCIDDDSAEPVPIAGMSQVALSSTLSVLYITPGTAGVDNDIASIALRIALAQFHLHYDETIILYVAVPCDLVGIAQADIRRRLWCFSRILALYSASNGSGFFIQVPPPLLPAVAQVLTTPTVELPYVKCVRVCLDPCCTRDPNACPQHKAPLCDVKYPCPSLPHTPCDPTPPSSHESDSEDDCSQSERCDDLCSVSDYGDETHEKGCVNYNTTLSQPQVFQVKKTVDIICRSCNMNKKTNDY